MPLQVWIGADAEAVAVEACARIAAALRDALARSDMAAIALAGGRTPRRTYELLRDADLDWARVHVGFTDERAVPPDHTDSNYRMIREALLAHVPIPSAHVHRFRGEATNLDAEAARAAADLEGVLGAPPRFHGIVLGMGADGHTASLFPGAVALTEAHRSAVAVRDAPGPHARLTLTLPVFHVMARGWVLALGPEKARAASDLVTGSTDSPLARACRARAVTLLLDRDAAARLPPAEDART